MSAVWQRAGCERSPTASRRCRRHHNQRHSREESPHILRLWWGAACRERGRAFCTPAALHSYLNTNWEITTLTISAGVVHRSDDMCGGRRHEGARQTRSSSCKDQLRRPAWPHFHHRGLTFYPLSICIMGNTIVWVVKLFLFLYITTIDTRDVLLCFLIIHWRKCYKCRWVNFSTSHLLWQEAVEKSSYFEPRRLLQRGDVTEAFKTVDKVYEGKSCLRTTGRNVCFFFLNSACFLLRGDSNWRPGAFLHGDAEHAGGSRRRGDGVQRLHLQSVANFDSGKWSRCVSVNLRVTQGLMAHQCSHVDMLNIKDKSELQVGWISLCRMLLPRRWTSHPTESLVMSKEWAEPLEGRSPEPPFWLLSPRWLLGSESKGLASLSHRLVGNLQHTNIWQRPFTFKVKGLRYQSNCK